MDRIRLHHRCRVTILILSIFTPGCYGLSEDWIPRSPKVDQGRELQSSRVFNGNGPDDRHQTLLDLQEVKTINKDWAILTARNFIYVLNLADVEEGNSGIHFTQIVPWLPENRTSCERKTADQNKCNNFIRISAQMTRHFFLVCGTNARQPKCREYQWNGTRFTGYQDGGNFIDENKCPLDDESSLAYVYTADGNFYAATRMGYRKDPGLRRTAVNGRLPSADFGLNIRTAGTPVVREEPMPPIATDNNDVSVLNDPTFVSAMETDDKVFLFFREVAEEQYGNGEMIVSRVGQVCKNDKGGQKLLLSQRWTSYFKARLNCSLPGQKPFQFNELRQITKPFVINGETVVFAAMTTPLNSIWGSAVCAYTVPAIETALNGNFMKRSSHDTSSVCLSKYGQNAPLHHPAACLSDEKDSRDLPVEDLKFRKNHPLVKLSVQPITEAPLFIRAQARYIFTAIDAEVGFADGASDTGITLLYIGTSDGHLLKVVPRPFDTDDKHDPNKKRQAGVFVEEILVYNRSKCSDPNGDGLRSVDNAERPDNEDIDDVFEASRKVRSVTVVKGRNLVLVGFQNCVIAVPKQICSRISCRKACVQSGNPYCGWLTEKCVAITDNNKDQVEQDLFGAKTDLPDCEKETSTTSAFVHTDECAATSAFAIPLAVSLCICFFLMLIAFLIITRRQIRKCTGACCSGGKEERSFSKGRELGSGENVGRGPIYKGPRGSVGSFGNVGRQSLSERSTAQHPHNGNAAHSSGEPAQRYGSPNSVDSFSKSSSCGSTGSKEERRKVHGVHIVEDVRDSSKPVPNSRRQGSIDNDPNLNNNNTKRNVGIAYALTREETPVRRRSTSNQDEERASTPTRSVRMGSLSGTTADASNRMYWKPQHPRIVTNPNFVAVSPMPVQKTSTVRPLGRENEGCTYVDDNRGLLPKPPASGLTRTLPRRETRLVSACHSVKNERNRTFGRRSSVTEPYYSETCTEPDYENVGYGKQPMPGNSEPDRPAPPPPNAKPSRKLSSFTASHFNTSWFPAQVAKNPVVELKMSHDHTNGKSHIRNSSSSSGITSSSSSASTGNSHEDSATWRMETNTSTNFLLNPALSTSDCGKQAKALGKISHSSDDGYGSGFVEDGRQSSNKPSEFPIPPTSLDFIAADHGYDSVPLQDEANGYEMPLHLEEFTPYESRLPSDDEENIKQELDEIQWSRGEPGRESKKKFTSIKPSKRKSTKKAKKQTNAWNTNCDVSSPSDNDDVFAQVRTPQPRCDYDDPTEGLYYGIDHSYMRDCIKAPKTLDDSFVDSKWENPTEYSTEPGNTCYAFHTMRPPGRMRQKLPRLRRGEKDSEATLIPVPPPEIPKI